ncbi:MAG TPA: DUF4097 family beta strand repeat-containing protein [Chitinivibrionales bacterium]|nr:DUF4097 family beta strand repeat-containing protein [Chitinivibrionales bacterium]
MQKYFLSTILRIGTAAAIAAVAGCVFNVERITTEKSGQIPSAGCTSASVDMSGNSGNITVSGVQDSIIKATVTVSELSTTGSASAPAADKLEVSIDTVSGTGTVAFAFTDNQSLWELLRLESIALSCNDMLGVSAKTTSGNITLTGINGFATLKTTSGNITADVVSGCDINVESGNIDVTLKPETGFAGASLKTTSGNVRVKVPGTFKADLELSTTSGSISAPGGDKTKLNGGDSTAVITCKTTSGNIRIETY